MTETQKSIILAFVPLLALVISAAALSVSAATFYYSQIRVKDSLLVSISSYATTSLPGQDICFTLTIANDGTRAAVLSDVGKSASGATMLDTPDAVSLSESLPLIIPPKEIRLLTVGVDGKQIQGTLSRKGTAEFYLAYEGSGPSGRRHYGVTAQKILVKEVATIGRWQTSAENPLRGLFQPVDLFQTKSVDVFKLHMWSTRRSACAPSGA